MRHSYLDSGAILLYFATSHQSSNQLLGIPWWVWVPVLIVLLILLLIGFLRQEEPGKSLAEIGSGADEIVQEADLEVNGAVHETEQSSLDENDTGETETGTLTEENSGSTLSA